MHQTRSPNLRGTTRLFLVGVLVAAAVLLGASLMVILSGDHPDVGDDGGLSRPFAPGTDERGSLSQRQRVEQDDGEWDYEDTDGMVDFGSRDPSGPVFVVTEDSIRKAIEARHWEEIRRMIDRFQKNGGEIPADIIESLIAFFDADDTRLDAVLALGQVKSDAAGLALAGRAADVSYSLEVRAAALQALAANGNASALTTVRALTADPGTDPKLLRYAFAALGGIGGQDAATSLVASLRAHQDDNLSGVIIAALGKSEGAGAVLAQTMREARDAADVDLASMVIRVAHLNGARADEQLRLEVRRMIEDPTATEFAPTENDRLGLRGSALSAASAIGGDLLDPVVQIARQDTDGLGGIALHALRQARGDAAAKKIVELLANPRDAAFQEQVAHALGATASYEATEALLKVLDSESGNARQAAARALSNVRDPKSTKPILERLASEPAHAVRLAYIDALGRIGANEALPTLERLRDSDKQEWQNLRPYIMRAMGRIKSGNPDAARMD